MGTEQATDLQQEDATDLQQEEATDLENRIITQIEYYFGDYNLRRDKFLKEKIKLDDGWVPLEVLMTFNRLKSLSEDSSVVIAALRKSSNNLVEINEDGTKIRRQADKPVPEYNPEVRTEVNSRTVYSKKFPLTTTLDELLQFFRGFGQIESVFMKKKPNKAFKGSVFVTFAQKEDADSFLNLNSIKYKNSELLRETKEDYIKRKDLEFQQRKEINEKKKGKKNKEEDCSEKHSEIIEKDFTKGCILKLSGLSENNSREDIQEVFSSHEEMAHLDYSRGRPVAHIRFLEGVADSVLEKVSKEEDGCKTITVNGVDAVSMVLTGDDEKEYWQNIFRAKSGKFRRMHSKKGKGRFNPRTSGKGRFRGGKRGRQHDTFEQENGKSDGAQPPKKMTKTEESANNSD